MEVSSHGEYTGTRECNEEGYATEACNGTKTVNCYKKLHVRMPTVKLNPASEIYFYFH